MMPATCNTSPESTPAFHTIFVAKPTFVCVHQSQSDLLFGDHATQPVHQHELSLSRNKHHRTFVKEHILDRLEPHSISQYPRSRAYEAIPPKSFVGPAQHFPDAMTSFSIAQAVNQICQ